MLFSKCIYKVTMVRSKKKFIKKYGREFWNKFKVLSNANFKASDIEEKNLFSFQSLGPCYMAWYKAFDSLGMKASEIEDNIWEMNMSLFSMLPNFASELIGKFFFNCTLI